MRSSLVFNYYTRITSPMTLLPSLRTIRGFTANNLGVRFDICSSHWLRLECLITHGSAATACSTDRSCISLADGLRRTWWLARQLTHVSLRRMVQIKMGLAY